MFLPSHSANRHNAGCGGAGIGGVRSAVGGDRNYGDQHESDPRPVHDKECRSDPNLSETDLCDLEICLTSGASSALIDVDVAMHPARANCEALLLNPAKLFFAPRIRTFVCLNAQQFDAARPRRRFPLDPATRKSLENNNEELRRDSDDPADGIYGL